MRNYLILLYKKDFYSYDSETGMPLETTTIKKTFPDYIKWQIGENPDNALAILYTNQRDIFIETDHYAIYSGWRAWFRFLFFKLFFWKYL